VDTPRKLFFLWEFQMAKKRSRRRFTDEFKAETVKLVVKLQIVLARHLLVREFA